MISGYGRDTPETRRTATPHSIAPRSRRCPRLRGHDFSLVNGRASPRTSATPALRPITLTVAGPAGQQPQQPATDQHRLRPTAPFRRIPSVPAEHGWAVPSGLTSRSCRPCGQAHQTASHLGRRCFCAGTTRRPTGAALRWRPTAGTTGCWGCWMAVSPASGGLVRPVSWLTSRPQRAVGRSGVPAKNCIRAGQTLVDGVG